MIKILVTGGRDYTDSMKVLNVLEKFYSEGTAEGHKVAFCQGGALGVDSMVKVFCKQNGIACFTCDSNWTYYSDNAGGIRNQWMLDFFDPDYLVAFPGGSGTADMVTRALSEWRKVYQVSKKGAMHAIS